LVNAATTYLKRKKFQEAILYSSQVLKSTGGMTELTRAKALYTRALATFSHYTLDATLNVHEVYQSCIDDLNNAVKLQGKKPSAQVSKLLKNIVQEQNKYVLKR
jgi:hypothetical protein